MPTYKVVLTYANYPAATQTVYLTGTTQADVQTFLDSNTFSGDTTAVVSATDIGANSGVPQQPTAGFTVDANTQALYSVDLDMQAANGDLTVNGVLQGVR